MDNTKKYLLGAVVVAIIAVYVIWANLNSGQPATSAPTPTPVVADNGSSTASGTEPTPTPAPVSGTSPSPTPTPAPTTTPAPAGQYKDGTYKGSVTDAFYGNLQVAAVISGGKLTDVQFLQYPMTPAQSIQVNGRSSPLLKQEAIAAQSANVNIVSGATQSSEAFQQSLAVALAQAKN